jgi:predicted RNA binding protein YcfA (HicA-like mRNA interferase family)
MEKKKEKTLKKRKLLEKILASTGNVRFTDLVVLVEAFGFRLSRVSGSHHIFTHPAVQELVNLQNKKGKAKPYQVRQFLTLVEQYNLELREEA